jgi:hypothetical protein
MKQKEILKKINLITGCDEIEAKEVYKLFKE